ncbi:MAG: hypothetical protein OJF52_000437 [Nitrospira sp.]|nr:MAG: hypothetical protein OJF52_000437 [Nitrospira sp.]
MHRTMTGFTDFISLLAIEFSWNRQRETFFHQQRQVVLRVE